MTDNPYDLILPPTKLDKAIDKALAEANAAYLANPQAQAEARETGERWAAWLAAERAAGPHAVVLPTALAQDLLARLRGEETNLPADLLGRMLADHLDKATRRTPKEH